MADTSKNQYAPDQVSPPGASLLDTLEVLGMSQADLAGRMGRPKKTINEIIKGRTIITAQTALQLEKVLGVPASFWANRERLYREYLARREDDAALAKHVAWARRYPVAAMVERKWVAAAVDQVGQVRELLRFFGIASPEQMEAACGGVRFRKSTRSQVEALQVWLRRGVTLAQEIACDPFDKGRFEGVLADARGWTRLEPQEFQGRLVSDCAKAGVAVVFVPELSGCGVHGATRWLSPTKALLQLSLFRKFHDQLVFTLFHEAEHILRHEKTGTFVETAGIEREPEEIEANLLAGERLIPERVLGEFLRANGKSLSAAKVQAFADRIGVCPGIVVGRLQHDRVLPFTHLNHLKRRLKWSE